MRGGRGAEYQTQPSFYFHVNYINTSHNSMCRVTRLCFYIFSNEWKSKFPNSIEMVILDHPSSHITLLSFIPKELYTFNYKYTLMYYPTFVIYFDFLLQTNQPLQDASRQHAHQWCAREVKSINQRHDIIYMHTFHLDSCRYGLKYILHDIHI